MADSGWFGAAVAGAEDGWLIRGATEGAHPATGNARQTAVTHQRKHGMDFRT
ncbi:hypothetical protein ACFOSC_00835 [Streptantibioticus rubrisoli]|uniref:Uncharacterized protein n=1 Tax=Streptantibioticus rubrisoli TaxID=1387313 RepID=A0ABT1PFS5_9ACTN|nr:hypothetical protein [Streptantibioticus rubrisoli]MCQ4043323.1 hypothetical protein [Streptantibioticus rubrisoli]